MIYLQQNKSNTITISANQTAYTNYYTWQLIRKGGFNEVIFYAETNSPVPEYWQSFTISCATYSGLTAGIINVNSGEYTFNVYEMGTPYNLNIASGSLCKTGICIISGTTTDVKSYSGTDNETIKYYKNI
jgi:hypothetical protein